ncbi:hypothetical protein [Novosphingobium terrae]|uniref:hypothetical protein n=1 Tax=Novosphingobium terrae TaxID=2726189 RepID=UPI00198078FC|nr:hypothetical protein [Novosphingobium terrae]
MINFLIALLYASTAPVTGAPVTHGGWEYFQKHCMPLPNHWRKQGCENGELMVANLLKIGNNKTYWNGAQVSEHMLESYLVQSRQLTPSAAIVLIIDARTSQFTANRYRRLIERRYGCDLESTCVEYSASAWKTAHSRWKAR